MAFLRVSYQPDDEWMGKVTVGVETDLFAGVADGWINASDLADFAQALDRYPLPPEQPVVLEVAYGGSIDGSIPPHSPVKVTIQPYGRRGRLLVCAELATDFSDSPELDLSQSVIGRFITGYAPLERFTKSLRGATSAPFKAATLEGSTDT